MYLNLENLDNADKWLRKYTYDTYGDKYPSDTILNTLVKRYPVEESTKIYRGINFRTKDQYDRFMESIKEGKLNSSSITSWTTILHTAVGFAYTTKSHYLTYDIASLSDKQHEECEKMMGYRGIVLSTTATRENGINVMSSTFSLENEIILVPTTVEVVVETEIKSFKDEFSEMGVNDFFQSLKREELDDDEMDKRIMFAIKNFSKDLTLETRKYLFNLYKPEDDRYIKVRIEENEKEWDKHSANDYKISLYFRFPLNIYPLLLEKDKKKIKKIVSEELDKEYDTISSYNKVLFGGMSIFVLKDFMDLKTWTKYFNFYSFQVRIMREEGEQKIREALDKGESLYSAKDYLKTFVQCLEQITG